MTKVDTARLGQFLQDASVLTVDQYVEGSLDTTALTPLMDIKVYDIADRVYPLRIYREEKDGKYAGTSQNGPAYFRGDHIRQILRPRSYFLKK